jgi:membrane protease subunit HflK
VTNKLFKHIPLLPRVKNWLLSLNDPQWGRGNNPDSPKAPTGEQKPNPSPGGNEGNNGQNPQPNKPTQPPDFDKIIQDLNKSLQNLFKTQKNQPPSSPPPHRGEPQPPLPTPGMGGIGIVIGLAVLVWLASGFYIVDEGKRGVVLQFGKYTETTQPGPRWHWPWPIEAREVVDISNVKSIEIGKRGSAARDAKASLMLTEDLNIVEATIEVQYTLKDAQAYLFNNVFPAQSAAEIVQQITETAIREAVGKRKMDALLSQGGRAEVVQAAQKLMQEILDRYRTGITVNKVNLQQINAPQQVIEAFNDVNKAEQDRDRLRNEGQAYANTVVPKAKGEAAATLEQASGYATSVVAKAEGDASRFSQLLTEYQKAPGVTRERLYLDMMQSVLGNTSKVLVDQKQGQNLLYLPMDKLIGNNNNSNNSSDRQEVAKTTPVPELATPEPSRPRDRNDALRNREGR